ncbi:MAG: hypothetical protein FD166_2985 [Bacteroidetes bacterium]|nr:MAG: hypothetical protein FD166_2985 [Bacteroidota bacterium]
MTNSSFVEDVYKSIKPGIPQKKRKEVIDALGDIHKKYQDLTEDEFKIKFFHEADPIIDTYSRINQNQELTTIRMVLYIFLILMFLSVLMGFFVM